MTNNNTTIFDEDGRKVFSEPSSEDKLFGMLIFLLNFFTAIIGPLIIWLIKREDSPYVDHHGKEYFNLIISFFVYELIAAASMFLLIGFVLVPIVSITFIVFIIIGAVKAYEGEYYRFPFIFRLF